jgi:hypothetical protein
VAAGGNAPVDSRESKAPPRSVILQKGVPAGGLHISESHGIARGKSRSVIMRLFQRVILGALVVCFALSMYSSTNGTTHHHQPTVSRESRESRASSEQSEHQQVLQQQPHEISAKNESAVENEDVAHSDVTIWHALVHSEKFVERMYSALLCRAPEKWKVTFEALRLKRKETTQRKMVFFARQLQDYLAWTEGGNSENECGGCSALCNTTRTAQADKCCPRSDLDKSQLENFERSMSPREAEFCVSFILQPCRLAEIEAEAIHAADMKAAAKQRLRDSPLIIQKSHAERTNERQGPVENLLGNSMSSLTKFG